MDDIDEIDTMDIEELRLRIRDDMPRVIDELGRLVAIASVGYEGYDPAHVRTSATLTRDLLEDAGVADARLHELDGGHPAVIGHIDGPKGAPTVLLYAHHDVQPAPDPASWSSPPFEPEVRDGRLFGRGAADDKSGIVVHLAALRAVGRDLRCSVSVLVEGEEECSTAHLARLLDDNADLVRADVAIIADGGNVRTGVPTIGTSVRGSTSVEVRVDVLPIAQHSGAFGGPLPDAIMSLARMLASLHDHDGNVAVEGLHRFTWDGTPVSEEEFREESRVFDQIRLIGTGSIADRTLSQPAINVLAFEAPRVADVANQIVPSARAVVGMRLAPGDDGARAVAALVDHLERAAPWGVRVTITTEEPGAGYLVDGGTGMYRAATAALGEAFGAEVAEMGSGGSIPLVPMLADRVPGMPIVIVGAGDHLSNSHSTDESVPLADLERLALAEAIVLMRLAG